MISSKFLQAKVEEFAASKAGKSAIKKTYGIDYNAKKDPFIQGRRYAGEMREILYKHIQSLVNEKGEKSLASVTLENIVAGEPKPDGKGNYSITISLINVDRDSFHLGKSSTPVYDIVGLFYHGYNYSLEKRAYGEWRGNFIASRISRDANSFAQDAVDEFNRNMKKKAAAKLAGKYAD